jgi:hypothetical protein
VRPSLPATTQEERFAATAKAAAYATHTLQQRVAALETLDTRPRLEAAEALLASQATTVSTLAHSITALGAWLPSRPPPREPGLITLRQNALNAMRGALQQRS